MHRRAVSTLTLALFFLTVFAPSAFAATGTIVSSDQYAWDDNGGYVNWFASGGNVTVTDTALTGYIWSAGFGWINLSPTNGGVTNNNGALSGYAWGENTGWIDFTGVTIDTSGVFHGHTVAQSTFGTMTFDCIYCDVVTSWRASAAATTLTPPGSSNGIPAQSGSLSFGYQATTTPIRSTTTSGTSGTIPETLRPTAPPPRVEPTTRPPKRSAHVAQQAGVTNTSTANAPEPVPPPVTPPVPKGNAVQANTPPSTPSASTATPACSIFTCWINSFWNFLRSLF